MKETGKIIERKGGGTPEKARKGENLKNYAVTLVVRTTNETKVADELVCIRSAAKPTTERVIERLRPVNETLEPIVGTITEMDSDYNEYYAKEHERWNKHFGGVYTISRIRQIDGGLEVKEDETI